MQAETEQSETEQAETGSVEIVEPKIENEIILEVKGLKQHFPIHQGFFQKVVGHIKAVDGVDLFIREREDGTRDRAMSVFSALLGPGTYTFGPLPSNKNFYSIGAVIPEPATICLLGFGALAALRRRK